MRYPRLLSALLLTALMPASIVTAARAANPLVAVRTAMPNAALLAKAQLVGRAPAATPVDVALTLPLQNQAQLQDLLRRMYTPGDPQYGHYLTPAQFAAQYGPSPAAYQAVVSAMKAQGLTVRTYTSRTLVGISGSSAAVAHAFHVQFNQYRKPSGRLAYANTAAPLVAASVAAQISGIIGLDNLVEPKPMYTRPRPSSVLLQGQFVGTDSSGGLSPNDIKRVYNLSNVGLQGEGQSIALAELGGYKTSDIGEYITHFNLPVNLNDPPLYNIYVNGFNGAVNSVNFETEVVSDIDMVLALAPRATRVYVYESNPDTPSFLQLFQQMADDHFAQTVSYSYGQSDTSLAQTGSAAYALQMNAENATFQQMAAEGMTICAAAGDNGAYNDGLTASVSDPAQQPFVTAVGGTTLQPQNSGTTTLAYGSESTWGAPAGTLLGAGSSGGGGGFSNYFAKPFYQYAGFNTANPTSGPVGASAGVGVIAAAGLITLPATPKRDLPDVSLDADPYTGYAVFVGDASPTAFFPIGGTSLASPLWAAFAALVNEARAADSLNVAPGANPGQANTPVGFLNPLIYDIGYGYLGSYADDMHDVSDYSNNLIYDATPGYDDATGWGSFNGANLLDLLASIAPGAVPGSGSGSGTTSSSGSATLTGTITFDNGTPPSGVTATIFAVSTDGTQHGSAVTGSGGAYSLSLAPGYTYNVTATANNYVGSTQPGIVLTSSGATLNFNLTDLVTANITPFTAGFQMVTEPYDFSATGLDFAGLFGLTAPIPSGGAELFKWQSQVGSYAVYPNAPADTLRPGQGYWLYVPSSDTSGLALHVQGQQVSAPFVVQLQQGWNQVGDPFVSNESLANITVSLDPNGQDAGSGPLPQVPTLVSPILWSYPSGATAYSQETATLHPYEGYWVYAFQPVYLTFH